MREGSRPGGSTPFAAIAVALLFACGPSTTPSAPGTHVATWVAAPHTVTVTSNGKDETLTRDPPKPDGAPTSHVDTFTPPMGGATLEIHWTSGNVVFPDGRKRRSVIGADVIVKDNPGVWQITGFFDDSPAHYTSDPEDVLAGQATLNLVRGHRSCGGTTFDNDELRVKLHGDGRAEQMPARPALSASASASISP